VVEQVFRTPKGDAAVAQGDQSTQQIVFRVTDVTVPPLDPASADAKRIGDTLKTSLGNDLYAQYVARVENDIGVSINQAALSQIVGGSQP
jgi:peptidyl-prolyl cis-trans isomerase D